jgi:hypothetical protein
MMKTAFLLTLVVAVLVCQLPAMPAQAAQVARTFVSAAGSDSNNCANVATPCRHLANAYAATAPGGEIDVLDPANYGALSISHAVSVQATAGLRYRQQAVNQRSRSPPPQAT